MLDVLKPLGHKKILENELEGFGIRMNKAPPNIIFKKKDKGGINLQVMVPQSELDLDLIKEILGEYRQGFIILGIFCPIDENCSGFPMPTSLSVATPLLMILLMLWKGTGQVSTKVLSLETILCLSSLAILLFFQELHSLHLLAEQD